MSAIVESKAANTTNSTTNPPSSTRINNNHHNTSTTTSLKAGWSIQAAKVPYSSLPVPATAATIKKGRIKKKSNQNNTIQIINMMLPQLLRTLR